MDRPGSSDSDGVSRQAQMRPERGSTASSRSQPGAADHRGFLDAMNRTGQRDSPASADTLVESDENRNHAMISDDDDLAQADSPSGPDDELASVQWPAALHPLAMFADQGQHEVADLTIRMERNASMASTDCSRTEAWSQVLRQVELPSAVGKSIQIELVGGHAGLASVQLLRDASGWQLKLHADRLAREALRHSADALETSLTDAGHAVSRIDFLES